MSLIISTLLSAMALPYVLILLMGFIPKIQASQAEVLIHMEALYSGNSVEELLQICSHLNSTDFIDTPGTLYKQCPANENCILHCNERRYMRLRDAQTRVIDMIQCLGEFQRIFWSIVTFIIVLLQGTYLFFRKQFSWKTLPFIAGHEFEYDPTDGYRYRHYMWMKWVILDSEHPTYYTGMTPETHELEYTPQIREWEDPDADDEDDIYHGWSVRDICDMTADPNDRLEIYFRRVQQKYHLNKAPRLTHGKFNKKRKR